MTTENDGFYEGEGSGGGAKFAKRLDMKNPKDKGEENAITYGPFRILPAMGIRADPSHPQAGRNYYYEVGHFGHPFSRNGKTQSVPFMCIEESRGQGDDKVITVRCPKCDQISVKEGRQRKLLAAIDDLKGEERAQAKAELKSVEDWLKAHNVTKAYLHYALDKSGSPIRLPIKYKAYQDMTGQAKTIKEVMGISQTSPGQGLLVKFRMMKFGDAKNDVRTSVEFVRDAEGNLVQAPLTAAQKAACKAAFEPDINANGIHLTAQQIQALIDGDNSPQYNTTVFNFPQKTTTATEPVRANEPPPHTDADAPRVVVKPTHAAPPDSKPAPTQAPVTQKPVIPAQKPVVQAPPPEVDEEAALMAAQKAQLEALRAKKEAAKKAAEVAAAKAQVAPKADPDFSDLPPDSVDADMFKDLMDIKK